MKVRKKVARKKKTARRRQARPGRQRFPGRAGRRRVRTPVVGRGQTARQDHRGRGREAGPPRLHRPRHGVLVRMLRPDDRPAPGRRRFDSSGVAAGAVRGARWRPPAESRTAPSHWIAYASGRRRTVAETPRNQFVISRSAVRFRSSAPDFSFPRKHLDAARPRIAGAPPGD